MRVNDGDRLQLSVMAVDPLHTVRSLLGCRSCSPDPGSSAGQKPLPSALYDGFLGVLATGLSPWECWPFGCRRLVDLPPIRS